MNKRPYIDRNIIRDDLRANGASGGSEYSQHCKDYEPIGSDGRNDWFRWKCRNCGKKFISWRSEKHKRYLRCTECDNLYFINKGFFDRNTETQPLQPNECSEPLIRFEATMEPNYGKDRTKTFYGSATYLIDTKDSDYWKITSAWRVNEDGTETLLGEGEAEILSEWDTRNI